MPTRSRARTDSDLVETTRAAFCKMPRSARIILEMLGRCTLTATAVPSCSVALCTWAVDAAANACGSKEA